MVIMNIIKECFFEKDWKLEDIRRKESASASSDPVNTFQDVTRRPSQGRVILVKVGKNFSHGIQDIINAFHRKEKQ